MAQELTYRDFGFPHMSDRRFLFICLCTVSTQAACFGARFLTSYRILELGGGAVAVGLIAAAFAVTPLLAAIAIGRTADGPRRRAVMPTGCMFMLGGSLFALLAVDLLTLTVANGALGLGQIMVAVAGQAAVASQTDQDRIDARFGHLALSVSLGMLIAFPVAGAAMSAFQTRGTHDPAASSFSCCVVLAIFAIPLSFAGRSRRSSSNEPTLPQGDVRPSIHAMLRPREMRSAMLSSLSMLAVTDVLTIYVPLLAEERSFSVAAATWLLTTRTVATIVSRAFLGMLIERVTRRQLLLSAMIPAVLPMLVLAWSTELWLCLASIATVGFFVGIGQPLTMSWVVELAPSGNRAAALSVRLMGNRVGQIAVPMLAAAVGSRGGAATVIVFSAGVLGSAGVNSWLTARRS